MSIDEIVFWWTLWLVVGAVLVLAAAALLLTIIALARSIAGLAGTALGVVEEIEENTRPAWQLETTNRRAGELATGAEEIAGNAEAIAAALGGSGEK
jgi:hypothetical protein